MSHNLSSVVFGEAFAIINNGKKTYYRVEPRCQESSTKGSHYCISHHTLLTNQFSKESHIAKGNHRMAWRCNEHGFEPSR